MTGPNNMELDSMREEYQRQTERDERISRRAVELRRECLNRTEESRQKEES